MNTEFERITKFAPAWDKRNSDPSKNYGIHSVQCFMVLKGPKGCIHFVFSTGMFLEETLDEYAREGKLVEEMGSGRMFVLNRPMGYDVGYHAYEKQYPEQELRWPTKMRKTGPEPLDVTFDKIGDEPPVCEWLGVPCYTDGSALEGDRYLKVLLNEGSDKVWEMLEEEYHRTFDVVE